MRAVIIGPGRIGCGYLAPLFRAAGWDVVLVARSPATCARIREAGGFEVTITSPAAAAGNDTGSAGRSVRVSGVDAVELESAELAEAIAQAEVVCTSVGVGNVAALAAPLAQALAHRRAPLDIWVVENGDCAGSLAERVRAEAGQAGLRLPPLGFGGAVAKVAVAHGSWHGEERPLFVGDDARELWVDERPLRLGVPGLEGVRGTPDYVPRLREKLFVFNAGHAIGAYLGWLRGHETIAEAVEDPYLRPMIAGCLLESRAALLGAYPQLGDDLHGPVTEALARYADPQLADPVVRVAREPIRKLARGDRLLGPAELVRAAAGRVPAYFALGVAGALLYRGGGDEQGRTLGVELARHGVAAVLEAVCGLDPRNELARAVAARYRGFILTPEETIFPPAHPHPAPAV